MNPVRDRSCNTTLVLGVKGTKIKDRNYLQIELLHN